MWAKVLNAHFLRGLGTGLIVAALFFIAWPSKEALTDDQIRQSAQQLGMVDSNQQQKSTSNQDSNKRKSLTTNEKAYQEPENQLGTAQVPAAPQKPTATSPSMQASAAGSTPSTTTPGTSAIQKTNAQSQVSVENQIITVTVSPGANSEEIGDSLLAKGLITDSKAFNETVKRLGVASKFKIGNFNLHKGMDTTEIILQMTGK